MCSDFTGALTSIIMKRSKSTASSFVCTVEGRKGFRETNFQVDGSHAIFADVREACISLHGRAPLESSFHAARWSFREPDGDE